jgi:hypothetical protein
MDIENRRKLIDKLKFWHCPGEAIDAIEFHGFEIVKAGTVAAKDKRIAELEAKIEEMKDHAINAQIARGAMDLRD